MRRAGGNPRLWIYDKLTYHTCIMPPFAEVVGHVLADVQVVRYPQLRTLHKSNQAIGFQEIGLSKAVKS